MKPGFLPRHVAASDESKQKEVRYLHSTRTTSSTKLNSPIG